MKATHALAWAIAAVLSGSAAHAQISTTPQQGLAEHTPRHASIVGARIVVAPGKVIESGSIEIRNGLVADVRSGRHAAAGAMVIDARGKTVYPAFIDVHGSYGYDASARCRTPPAGNANAGPRRGPFAGMRGGPESAPSAPSAQHWNDRVCPERDTSNALTLDDEAAGGTVESQCAGSVPTINGTFTPNNPLTAFDGQVRTGTWRLTVSDNAGIDTGTLTRWCISGSTQLALPDDVFKNSFE